jgi:hypothetical protein
MTQATIQQVQPSDEETSNQIDSFAKSNKKTKATIYLTEEAERAFAELYIARYRKDRKVDRSTIACEAIQALYERECREKN